MPDYFRQSTENRSICSYYTTPQASDTEQIPNSYLSGDIEGDFRTTRLPSRLSTRGEADRERLFRSPFNLVASLGGVLTGDSRVSLGFFFADAGGSEEAEDDEDRLASRVFDFFTESASA